MKHKKRKIHIVSFVCYSGEEGGVEVVEMLVFIIIYARVFLR